MTQHKPDLTHVVIWLLLGCTALSACSQQQINVTEVLNHGQCKSLRSGVSQVAFADLATIRGVTMLSDPNQTEVQSADAAPELLLIAVSNGSQPTPGYRFELIDASAQNRDIHLNYHWHTPPADAVLAQMITSPCSVVQLDTTAQLGTIYAFLDGEPLGSLDLQP